MNHERLQPGYIGKPGQWVSPPREWHLLPFIGGCSKVLVACKKQLNVLDTGDAVKTRSLAEPSKLAETGEGERVEAVEDVDPEEIKPLTDLQDGQHFIGLDSAAGDGALRFAPKEALGQSAAVFAE